MAFPFPAIPNVVVSIVAFTFEQFSHVDAVGITIAIMHAFKTLINF